ncbi:probable monooxygenase [Ustilago trichophora]|uniref:Probable monooxygenase n=1 Tax=Ustilago trichophora TaxID=86804 RepID=A0A5C3EE88_9BASI|nr:probable monooxygenase [Ustilago trichophora]
MGSIPDANLFQEKETQGHVDDVLIVGAGISGINAACRLIDSFATLFYTILEARHTLGGTWDLFKYPGIRSDSDLHTFGYAFKAWRGPAIAAGPEILKYLNTVADQYRIPEHTRFHTKVREARWSSAEKLWTVQTVHAQTGEEKVYKARFYWNCCGYYDYDQPLEAHIPGLDSYQGIVAHPQFWKLTEDDYKGKNVAVIGSGATAITILPSLAGIAKHITLVQRSPSYIVAANPVDSLANSLHRWLPEAWASFLIRQRNIARSYAVFHIAKTFPNFIKNAVISAAKKSLPPNVAVEKHFTPRYNPWDQRVCLSPHGDFYQAIREGKASVATGNIQTINSNNQIILDSGDEIDADVIITATGLKLQLGGGVNLFVDDKPVQMNERYIWRGCMIEGVPNFAFTMGYTNLSWTLGSDCTAHFVVRLLSRLANSGKQVATPEVLKKDELEEAKFMDMSSTYIARAKSYLPKVATKGPWQRRSNYWVDMWNAKYASLDQLVLV